MKCHEVSFNYSLLEVDYRRTLELNVNFSSSTSGIKGEKLINIHFYIHWQQVVLIILEIKL